MTPKQRKAVSIRMKQYWAERNAAKARVKEIDDREDKWNASVGLKIAASVVAPDLVNHPPHYTFGKYEVIDVLMDWFRSEPLLWNATKYLARWDKKGEAIENLEKAVWYINKKIEQLKGE